MKKILSVMTLLLLSVALHAQKEVTKFLGIPVDGSKSEMIQKLQAKGFKYNRTADLLEGNFNDNYVQIAVVTNSCGKVWRLAVFDAVPLNVVNIKIRFNKLCRQFAKNKKYYMAEVGAKEFIIPEDEDIQSEILLHKKRYEAAFYQMDSLVLLEELKPILLREFTSEQIANPTEIQRLSMQAFLVPYIEEKLSKATVWFVISDEIAGSYRICMYYDNKYNQSDGEDL